jgi:hypothetical protein
MLSDSTGKLSDGLGGVEGYYDLPRGVTSLESDLKPLIPFRIFLDFFPRICYTFYNRLPEVHKTKGGTGRKMVHAGCPSLYTLTYITDGL